MNRTRAAGGMLLLGVALVLGAGDGPGRDPSVNRDSQREAKERADRPMTEEEQAKDLQRLAKEAEESYQRARSRFLNLESKLRGRLRDGRKSREPGPEFKYPEPPLFHWECRFEEEFESRDKAEEEAVQNFIKSFQSRDEFKAAQDWIKADRGVGQLGSQETIKNYDPAFFRIGLLYKDEARWIVEKVRRSTAPDKFERYYAVMRLAFHLDRMAERLGAEYVEADFIPAAKGERSGPNFVAPTGLKLVGDMAVELLEEMMRRVREEHDLQITLRVLNHLAKNVALFGRRSDVPPIEYYPELYRFALQFDQIADFKAEMDGGSNTEHVVGRMSKKDLETGKDHSVYLTMRDILQLVQYEKTKPETTSSGKKTVAASQPAKGESDPKAESSSSGGLLALFEKLMAPDPPPVNTYKPVFPPPRQYTPEGISVRFVEGLQRMEDRRLKTWIQYDLMPGQGYQTKFLFDYDVCHKDPKKHVARFYFRSLGIPTKWTGSTNDPKGMGVGVQGQERQMPGSHTLFKFAMQKHLKWVEVPEADPKKFAMIEVPLTNRKRVMVEDPLTATEKAGFGEITGTFAPKLVHIPARKWEKPNEKR